MRKLLLSFGAVLLMCGATCEPAMTPAQEEQAKRARWELQSVMDMVSTKKIPPIEFETDSDIIKDSSYPLLNKVAEILKRYDRLKLIVIGHTDDVGPEDWNKRLSRLRASAVKEYIASQGVWGDYIKVYGYGSEFPAVEGHSAEARARNRRVEFVITTRDWGSVY